MKHSSPAHARLFEDFQQEYWNVGNRISFHEAAHVAAQSILITCGLSPETTAAFVDGENPILECVSCGETLKKRLMMTWRRAVSFPDLLVFLLFHSG